PSPLAGEGRGGGAVRISASPAAIQPRSRGNHLPRPWRSRHRCVPILSGVSYRSSRLLRRLLLAAPLVTIASVSLASPTLAATGLNPLLPNAVSPNGHNLYDLYIGISIPALVIFFLVEGLLLTIIIRDRRRRHDPGYR